MRPAPPVSALPPVLSVECPVRCLRGGTRTAWCACARRVLWHAQCVGTAGAGWRGCPLSVGPLEAQQRLPRCPPLLLVRSPSLQKDRALRCQAAGCVLPAMCPRLLLLRHLNDGGPRRLAAAGALADVPEAHKGDLRREQAARQAGRAHVRERSVHRGVSRWLAWCSSTPRATHVLPPSSTRTHAAELRVRRPAAHGAQPLALGHVEHKLARRLVPVIKGRAVLRARRRGSGAACVKRCRSSPHPHGAQPVSPRPRVAHPLHHSL